MIGGTAFHQTECGLLLGPAHDRYVSTDGSDGRLVVAGDGRCRVILIVSYRGRVGKAISENLPRRKDRIMDDMICPVSSSMINLRFLRAWKPS